MLRAIAIDDEPLPLDIISQFCQKSNKIHLEKTFTSTLKAKYWLESNHVDLLFLDINMPAISGLDFYQELEDKVMVIFTTAYSEYAVEGFNLSAIDYLLKPYSFERFEVAVQKADEYHSFHHEKGHTGHFFVKSDLNIVKIYTEQIVTIQAYADYLKIFLDNGKMVMTRMTMKGVLDLLPADFRRVHKSYIVPIGRITRIQGKDLYINEEPIPIGKTYLDEVKKAISRS